MKMLVTGYMKKSQSQTVILLIVKKSGTRCRISKYKFYEIYSVSILGGWGMCGGSERPGVMDIHWSGKILTGCHFSLASC